MHKSIGSRPSAVLKSQATRIGIRKTGLTGAGDSSLLSSSSSASASLASASASASASIPSSLTAINGSRQLTVQQPRRGRRVNNITTRNMASKPQLNVHDFPRPPLLERTPRHLVIKWNNQVVADTKEAYWVLETTHPPTYYLPPSSITSSFTMTQVPNKSSLCEWKGRATYWSIRPANAPSSQIISKIWSYETPTPSFTPIKGYLSFYASSVPWECFVDGEKVQAQPGDFYGGWSTSELVGIQKGGPGTWGW